MEGFLIVAKAESCLTPNTPLSVSELTEKIKALKSARTSGEVSDRVSRVDSSGEEPVTARIRRRLEAMLSSDHSVEVRIV